MLLASNCEKDTYELGARLADSAMPGDIICLDGDLGAGKTVFTKGFAAGLGITEPVTSPTFTIIHSYAGRLPLHHFDVYRIEDEDEMFELGYEEYFFGEGVCLIEWSTLIPSCIPAHAVHITIERDYSQSDEYRKITIEGATPGMAEALKNIGEAE